MLNVSPSPKWQSLPISNQRRNFPQRDFYNFRPFSHQTILRGQYNLDKKFNNGDSYLPNPSEQLHFTGQVTLLIPSFKHRWGAVPTDLSDHDIKHHYLPILPHQNAHTDVSLFPEGKKNKALPYNLVIITSTSRKDVESLLNLTLQRVVTDRASQREQRLWSLGIWLPSWGRGT